MPRGQQARANYDAQGGAAPRSWGSATGPHSIRWRQFQAVFPRRHNGTACAAGAPVTMSLKAVLNFTSNLFSTLLGHPDDLPRVGDWSQTRAPALDDDRVMQSHTHAWLSRTSRATAPAATYAFAMPTIDGGGLDQHQRFPPPGPQPPQTQPQQTVSRAKAPLRTSEDAELVAHGKSLEQEVSTRCRADRNAAPVLMTAHIACRVPGNANVNAFWPHAIMARHRGSQEVSCDPLSAGDAGGAPAP